MLHLSDLEAKGFVHKTTVQLIAAKGKNKHPKNKHQYLALVCTGEEAPYWAYLQAFFSESNDRCYLSRLSNSITGKIIKPQCIQEIWNIEELYYAHVPESCWQPKMEDKGRWAMHLGLERGYPYYRVRIVQTVADIFGKEYLPKLADSHVVYESFYWLPDPTDTASQPKTKETLLLELMEAACNLKADQLETLIAKCKE
jgi:hypothetical protein